MKTKNLKKTLQVLSLAFSICCSNAIWASTNGSLQATNGAQITNGATNNAIPHKCNLVVQTTATKASCLICPNGTASASINGGTAPFSYKWSNGDTTSSISNLVPGVYTCCVKDAKGCRDCSTVIVHNGDTAKCTLMVTTTATETSCLTCANGSASATVTGGTAPLTYKWNNGDSTASITNLLPGVYTCCVKDSMGCHSCSTIIVHNGDTAKCTLTLATSATQATCLTCPNGSATATITGGLAPITYKWSNGDTTASLSNLLPGVYTCCVKDANGCHDCSTVIVKNADTAKCTLAVTTSAIATTCLTCPNGSATASATGGLAPVTYQWNNGDTTATLSNLLPGVYTCCVKDANGCHDCSTVIVKNGDTAKCALTIAISATATTCLTCPDGSATAAVTGGLAPVTYRWSNGDTTTSISNLLPGVYTCCVKDANGCHDCSTVIVHNGDTAACTLKVSGSSTVTTCFTCANGSATATATGGLAPLQYRWSTGDTTATITNLTPGVYTCCVKDANGCLDCTIIIVHDSTKCTLALATSATQASCFICHNGTATATITGGTAPFSYKWSNGDTTSSITNLAPGAYLCCVKDSNGCHDCSIVLVGDSSFHPSFKGATDNGDNTTGMRSLNMDDQDITSYPNPSNGTFRVVVNGVNSDQNAELDITNLLGQVVLQTNAPVVNGTLLKDIALQNIPNGTYFVRIITTSKIYNTKIVVNK